MANFKKIQLEFTAHIRDPKNNPVSKEIEDRRMGIYRNLFINSLSGILENTFPVIRSLYINENNWLKLVRSFFKKEYNKTPYFPEIARDFVQFLQQTTPCKKKPFLAELAHYEWLELYLDKHSAEINKQPIQNLDNHIALNKIPIISSLSEIHRFEYPVHQIQQNHQPRFPMETPIFILLWRNTEYTVKFSQLNVFSALLYENLKTNQSQTGQQIITALAEQINYNDKKQLAQHGSELMVNWYHKDIIIDFQ